MIYAIVYDQIIHVYIDIYHILILYGTRAHIVWYKVLRFRKEDIMVHAIVDLEGERLDVVHVFTSRIEPICPLAGSG